QRDCCGGGPSRRCAVVGNAAQRVETGEFSCRAVSLSLCARRLRGSGAHRPWTEFLADTRTAQPGYAVISRDVPGEPGCAPARLGVRQTTLVAARAEDYDLARRRPLRRIIERVLRCAVARRHQGLLQNAQAAGRVANARSDD